MRTPYAIEETTTWESVFLNRAVTKPVTIRLAIFSNSHNKRTPAIHYLVTTGFFKILNELNVLDYHHQYGMDGLTYYIDVAESRSAVRAYLLNLKKFHALGQAWELSIIEGMHVSSPIQENRVEKPLKGYELESLARMHMNMGSRPLRYSRYFLYAALAPFGRSRSYGSCSMSFEDAKGNRNFFHVLQALEILVRSYSSLDFSSINSLQALRSRGIPIEDALNQVSSSEGMLRGLLFHSIILAAAYEQKTPMQQIPDKIKSIVKGMEKDFSKDLTSSSTYLLAQYGVGGARALALAGYEPIIDKALPFWQNSMDIDDLSLFLLGQTYDTTTLKDIDLLGYQNLQDQAEKCLADITLDRNSLNQAFYKLGLVTDGISDLISVVLLFDLIASEESRDAME